MPELPEIATRARQMNAELKGKVINEIDIIQPKCLNLLPDEFNDHLAGACIEQTTYRGKWLFTHTSRGWLLINLGMGGEILLGTPETLPEKKRLIIYFTDASCLTVNFWWFGYVHFVPEEKLHQHTMTARLGPNALDVDAALLRQLSLGLRTRVKTFLLDQSKIAGIGNAYVHDILFLARLHPLRPIDSLTPDEINNLATAIQEGLRPSLAKNGAFYEVDLHGNKGFFEMSDILIGYKEGQPCPRCQTPIEKIKTGSTSSFICPRCQQI